MKTSTASLGALLLLSLALPARAQVQEEVGIVFHTIRVQIQDPGRTGLAAGAYDLSFDRREARTADRLEARLAPAGRGGEPLRVVIPALELPGCRPPKAEGSPTSVAKVTLGPRSLVRATALASGAVRLEVRAEGNASCVLSVEVPPAAGLAAGGTAAPPHGVPGPGGITLPERPPQCTPPNFPSDAGSPQPSVQEPGLTSTPVSPPDGGCELTELPLSARLQEVEDPALREALLALRGDVERLTRTRRDDHRSVVAARQRIQRDLSAISQASRRGDAASTAGRCETARNRCERACGGRDCCCCTATYVNCLLGH